MVASIKVIRSTTAGSKRVSEYFTKGEVSVSYYLQNGTTQGRWFGKGAQRLGLEGSLVTQADFLNVLLGRDTKGVELRPPSRRQVKAKTKNRTSRDEQKQSGAKVLEPQQVRGVDMTFSAPKSVSILHALFNLYAPDKAREIEQAFTDSVHDTLRLVETEINTSRRGKRGMIQAPGEFIAAIFQHELPRNYVQPQLHNHCVIASTVRRDDGEWGTLNTKELFNAVRSLGPYQACQFAKYLQERLGLEIEIPIDPVTEEYSTSFEVAGISREVIEQYSSRRKELLERVELDGGKSSSAQARSAANLKTRLPKSEPITQETILEAWKELSRTSGLNQETVLGMLSPPEQLKELSNDEIKKAILSVADELVVHDATFTALDLLRCTCERLQGAASGEAIKEAIHESLLGRHFVHVNDLANGELFTTRKHWDLEKELIRDLDAVAKTYSVGADKVEVELALARKPHLSDEQRAAVEYCCSAESGGVRTVLGSAGSGKTTMLSTVAEAFIASGKKVIGAALAGTATRELEAVGIESRTIASLLYEFFPERYLTKSEQFTKEMYEARNGKTSSLDSNTLLILDEASMTGADEIGSIAKKCKELGVSLLLSGDLNQLTSINAACPLSYVAKQFGYVSMTQNRRQLDELDRVAVDLVREGDIEGALKNYRDRGRLTITPTRGEAVEQLINEWIKDGNSNAPEKALILTQTNRDCGIINRDIQAQRLLDGTLGSSTQVTRDLSLHENDRIVFREQVGRQISTGEMGTVVSLNHRTKTARIQFDGDNRIVDLPFKKLDKALLGYAVTTHRSQGKTVDFSYVFMGGSMTSTESIYVQLTRARHSTKLYCDELHAGPKLETIIRSLQRSERKALAHQLVPQQSSSQDPNQSLERSRNQ